MRIEISIFFIDRLSGKENFKIGYKENRKNIILEKFLKLMLMKTLLLKSDLNLFSLRIFHKKHRKT